MHIPSYPFCCIVSMRGKPSAWKFQSGWTLAATTFHHQLDTLAGWLKLSDGLIVLNMFIGF